MSVHNVIGCVQSRSQELKQSPLCPFMGLGGLLVHGGSIGGSRIDQLSQRLSFDGGVLGDEFCKRTGVGNEGVAPLLETVKKVASCRRLTVDVGGHVESAFRLAPDFGGDGPDFGVNVS